MIKTLRRKFIAAAMLAVILVLAILIGGINIANYCDINRNLSLRLDMLEANGGKLPAPEDRPDGFHDSAKTDNNVPPSEDSSSDNNATGHGNPPPSSLSGFGRPHKLSEESPFDTRFFTVTFDADGNIAAVNIDHVASTSEDEAKKIAQSVFAKNKSDGFYGSYKFRKTTSSDDPSSVMYIFLNASRELDTFHSFLYASIGICLLGCALIFLLVVIFSKIILRPVAESYEKQKRFITDASHEIKTPLAIIEANTEVVEMEAGESEWTKSIRNQVARLASLTEKLVFLSRMDEENTRLTMIDFNLSDVALDTAEGFFAVAEASGKDLVLSIAPDITFCGDKDTLRQLISLLLDNATKYASEGSAIRFSLETYRKGKYFVRMIEENNVDEIEKGSLDVLFERFYRSDPSRNSQTGGHGIGLSVAAAIVHAHGGAIHAESPDGKSIHFEVLL